MSLQTGQMITRYTWDPIPMPDTEIAHMNLLGKDQVKELTFFDHSGRSIGDVELPGVDPGDEHQDKVVIAPFDDNPAEDFDLNNPNEPSHHAYCNTAIPISGPRCWPN